MWNQDKPYQAFQEQEAFENETEPIADLPFKTETQNISQHQSSHVTAARQETESLRHNAGSVVEMPANQNRKNNGPIEFKIHQHLGILATNKSGWMRELNVVSWNGKQARLDIRDWHPEHVKMGRGIGLNRLEAENLLALLRDKDLQTLGI